MSESIKQEHFKDKIVVPGWRGRKWCRVIREYGGGYLRVRTDLGEEVTTKEDHIIRDFYINDETTKKRALALQALLEASNGEGICVGPASKAMGVAPIVAHHTAMVRPDLFQTSSVELKTGESKYGYSNPVKRSTNAILITKKV